MPNRFTIIGVMPPSFRFPHPGIELWSSLAPIYNLPAGSSIGDWVNIRSAAAYRVVGRLGWGRATGNRRSRK